MGRSESTVSSSQSPIRLVLSDIDGTWLDNERLHQLKFLEIARNPRRLIGHHDPRLKQGYPKDKELVYVHRRFLSRLILAIARAGMPRVLSGYDLRFKQGYTYIRGNYVYDREFGVNINIEDHWSFLSGIGDYNIYNALAGITPIEGVPSNPNFSKAVTPGGEEMTQAVYLKKCEKYYLNKVALLTFRSTYLISYLPSYQLKLRRFFKCKVRRTFQKTLSHFRSQGVPVVAVSGGTPTQVIANRRVMGERNFVLCLDATAAPGRGKPLPDLYLKALERANVMFREKDPNHKDILPEECLVFEDNRKGCDAGLAAGMQVLHWPSIPSEPHHPDATYKLEHGASLANFVKANIKTTSTFPRIPTIKATFDKVFSRAKA